VFFSRLNLDKDCHLDKIRDGSRLIDIDLRSSHLFLSMALLVHSLVSIRLIPVHHLSRKLSLLLNFNLHFTPRYPPQH
jgi:hypothetical protein